jgi:transcriptional regulator with XRE-family HTH domain
VTTELAIYLQGIMDDRRLSQRALAIYADVASSTISRIMRGMSAEPETLVKLANYLNVPVDTLYRKAGMLPTEEEHKQDIIRVIEHLLGRLPESDQQEILDLARIKVARIEKLTAPSRPGEIDGTTKGQ